MSDTVSTQPAPKPRALLKSLWALTVAAVLLASGQFLTGKTTGDIGYDAGYGLGATVVVWAILYFGYARRLTPRLAIAYLPVLIAVTTAVAVVKDRALNDNMRTATSEISASYGSLVSPQKGGRPIDSPVRATGDIGLMEGVMKSVMAKVAAERASQQADMAATGFSGVLAPQYFASHRDFAAGHASVLQARQVVEMHRPRLPAIMAAAREQIAGSLIEENLRTSTLRGFDESWGKTQVQLARFHDLQVEEMDEADAMLTLLDRSRGQWVVKDDQLTFRNDNAMNAYNAHLLKTQQLEAEQNAINQKGQSDEEHKLQELNRLSQ